MIDSITPPVGGHTPGPWLADFHNEHRYGGRFIAYVRGGNQLVPTAAVPTGVEGYGREEGRANACLIAAAPELLAALVEILGPLNVCSDNPHVRDDQVLPVDMTMGELRKARAAISKATGVHPHE